MEQMFEELKRIALEQLKEPFDLKCFLLWGLDVAVCGVLNITWTNVFEHILFALITLFFTLVGGTMVYFAQKTYGTYYVQKWWNKKTEEDGTTIEKNGNIAAGKNDVKRKKIS